MIGLTILTLLSFPGPFESVLDQSPGNSIEASTEAGVSSPADDIRPGAVYREFALHNGGNDWRVTDPDAGAAGAKKFLPNPVLPLRIDDLQGAVRAEAVLDRWGGHLKTANLRIRFNDNDWLAVPAIQSTPSGRSPYFYSQDNPVVSVPLAHLRAGLNQIEGTCATVDGYQWGQWGLYSIILRVYYPKETDVQVPRITHPASGDVLTEHPEVRVTAPVGSEQVQVLAFFDGDDEDGDGVFREWHGGHFQPKRGAAADLRGHVGTDRQPPFHLLWDTTWVPDQEDKSIKLVARVKLRDGRWIVSPIVDRLSLERKAHHVRLIRARNVPERFGVRVGRKASCTFQIPDQIPLDRVEARLSLRTWHGWDGHHHPLQINNYKRPIDGNNHHYDHDLLPLPAKELRHGENVFTISSDTEHHMLEVLWPGPTLLLRW